MRPPPCAPHVRRGGVRAEKRGAQVDVDVGVPVGGGQLGERLLHVDRRHVDEDVEAAEGVDDRLHQRRARRPAATGRRLNVAARRPRARTIAAACSASAFERA